MNTHTHTRTFRLGLVALLLVGAVLAPTLPASATPGPVPAGDDSPAESAPDKASQVVNINTAGADQLALLPRVGPALSGRIIEFREENGEFQAAEDLILVRGIGEKTFELLERWVVIQGETTLDHKVSTAEATADQ